MFRLFKSSNRQIKEQKQISTNQDQNNIYKIYYTFNLPINQTELMEILPSTTVDKTQPLQAISQVGQENLLYAFSQWETIALVKFIENTNYFNVTFFEYTSLRNTHSVDNYVHAQTYQVSHWAAGFSTQKNYPQQIINNKNLALRLTGYILGLKNIERHEIPQEFQLEYKRDFMGPYDSIMYNYNDGYSFPNIPIAVTPTSYDIAQIHKLFSFNQSSSADTLYNLKLLSNHFRNYDWVPLMTLWDAGGINTMSCEGSYDCKIDLLQRFPGYEEEALSLRSEVYYKEQNDFQITNLKIANGVNIHNIIGGGCIILNSHDNVVQIKEPTHAGELVDCHGDFSHTLIWVNRTNCGHDIIFNFDPAKDRLGFLYKEGEQRSCTITSTFHMQAKIGTESLYCLYGTKFSFDDKNSVVLACVKPSDLYSLDYEGCDYKSIPGEITKSFFTGFGISCALSLMDFLLHRIFSMRGHDEEYIQTANDILSAFTSYILSGSITSSAAGYLTYSLFSYFECSKKNAALARNVVTTTATLAQDLSPLGLARTAASAVGGYIGGKLTMWGTKIYDAIDQTLDDIEFPRQEDNFYFII